MSLLDAFRRVEDKARRAARASAELAMVSLDDAERAVRRRMRIYPKQHQAVPLRMRSATSRVHVQPAKPSGTEQPLGNPPHVKAS